MEIHFNLFVHTKTIFELDYISIHKRWDFLDLIDFDQTQRLLCDQISASSGDTSMGSMEDINKE